MIGPGDGGIEESRSAAEFAAAFGVTQQTEAQPEKPEGEVLLGRMEEVLTRTRVFGRSIADFALRRGAIGALRYGTRELAKGIFSWSGAAAAVGGGVTGTMAVGAFAGAVAATVVEYARQIKNNLDQRISEQEADPELLTRKQIFLRRGEGLLHKEAYKADFRKLGKAALFGAVVGAGAGALVEHIPQIAEFIREHAESLRPVASGAGEMMGAAGRTIGGTAGDFGHGIGEAAGAAGRTTGDILSGARDLAGHISNPEYPDLGGIPQVTTEVAESAGQAAQEAVDNTSALAAAAKAAKEQAVSALTSNHEFLERTAAAVGEQLDQSNLAVDEAIRAAGMDPTALSAEAYENIRMSVQHKMEGLANEAFNHAASSADNLDPSHLAEIAKQGHYAFVDSLNGADTHQQLLGVASKALTEHMTAVEQAIAHAQSALDNFGDSIPLPAGSNPWEVSAGILKQMGVVDPSPEQIMQLNKIICQESGINVPEWGIPGTIDAHKLPVGFNINLTDTVKKIALGIASKK